VAGDRQIVELHWRDFAVFVSLSSRTNTRQGRPWRSTLSWWLHLAMTSSGPLAGKPLVVGAC